MSIIYYSVILFFSLFADAKIENEITFSVMSYNVENLFDSLDDPGFEDETYLPLADKNSNAHRRKCKRLPNFRFRKDCYHLDWNKEVINRKMVNLSNVILSVENGNGPDILILIEVENRNILKQFNQEYLKAARYKTIELIDGDDPRGIDIAILSRFGSVGKVQLLPLNIKNPGSDKTRRTRGVLKVPLQIAKDKVLNVYGIHLPSQGSPVETRIQGLGSLVSILKKDAHAWLVGGDFNITEKENQEHQLIETYLSTHGQISHRIGCFSCRGTHRYKDKWSFLDWLFFDRRFKDKGLAVINESIQTISTGMPLGKKGSPQRFVPEKGQGASDHFPIYARLKVEK